MAQNQVSDDHALHFLASEGYLPLALADQPGMVEAYARLFAQTTKFFNLPASSPEKTDHQAASGAAASEEGYSHIPDEKSIMTVKTSARCPASLQPALQTAWGLTGAFMAKVTTAIARTLDLHPDVFSPFVDPCTALPPTERTPTLVRMFRYDRRCSRRAQGQRGKAQGSRHAVARRGPLARPAGAGFGNGRLGFRRRRTEPAPGLRHALGRIDGYALVRGDARFPLAGALQSWRSPRRVRAVFFSFFFFSFLFLGGQ